MDKKYKSLEELENRCESYLEEHTLVAPRTFRVWLGVSKHLLSTWKHSDKKEFRDYFNLIKEYEDKILAKVEEYSMYGLIHPDISENFINEDGRLVGSFNTKGLQLTLRAYDREQYNEQLHLRQYDRKLTLNDADKANEPVQIIIDVKGELERTTPPKLKYKGIEVK